MAILLPWKEKVIDWQEKNFCMMYASKHLTSVRFTTPTHIMPSNLCYILGWRSLIKAACVPKALGMKAYEDVLQSEGSAGLWYLTSIADLLGLFKWDGNIIMCWHQLVGQQESMCEGMVKVNLIGQWRTLLILGLSCPQFWTYTYIRYWLYIPVCWCRDLGCMHL